jgi:protein-S-isoprenylcysteine O-methyltransferase Ste14
LAFLGAAFVGNHWILFVTTLGLFLCYDWGARKEERLLASQPGPLGQQYVDFMRRTWRWVPFVW